MWKGWGSLVLGVIVPSLIFGGAIGCAPHQPWRVAPGTGQPAPTPAESSWLPGEDGAETVIVEFDDQGEVWRDSQTY